jgi:glycosyltransferase involved in cell wall biosynthesis
MNHPADHDARLIAELRLISDRLARFDAQERARLQQSAALATQVSELGAQVSEANAQISEVNLQVTHVTARLEALIAHQTAPEPDAPLVRLQRSARSNLIRARLAMRAHPKRDVRQVEGQSGAWISTGRDPSFDLIPPGKRCPSGWVSIEFELASEKVLGSSPMLYVDHGAGYSEAGVIPLPRPHDGVIRTLIHIDTPVRALRFDPVSRKGITFTLGALTMSEMGQAEATARMMAPLAKEVLADPKRTWSALGKVARTIRSDGLRGIKQQLRARFAHATTGYDEWVVQFDTLEASDRAAIQARIGELPVSPLISVVMPVYQPPEQWLRRAIDSVREQLYPNWELCIADDASKGPEVRRVLEEYAAKDARIKVVFREKNGHISETSNSALELATGEFVALLDHDDELPAHALYLIAEEICAHPDVDLIYSDEDKIDVHGRRYNAYFKPDWDPDLFGSQNYFSHLGVYRTALVREVGGFRKGLEGSQDYDLALRCIEKTDRVRHIPHVLYHWRAIEGSTAKAIGEKSYAQTAAERALKDHFAKIDSRIEVTPGVLPTVYRARRPLPVEMPLVSILIPTRDGYEILKRCIDSVIARTSYPNYEIVIVDNQSEDKATLAYFKELEQAGRARIVAYDAPFNYSAINNLAAREARGELLLLLNNDIETIHPDWLGEMVSQAVRPEIGAVGAKLLYPDNTLQHAGVITGIHSVAGHIYRRLARDFPGYYGRAQMVQRMTVVTAACLLVRRSIYEEVGGLDAENLKVAFNDVDFCMRIAEAGYRNLYTPFAELHHHESYSRGNDDTPAKKARFDSEVRYMLERWGDELNQDPAYNPNLSLSSEYFDLAWPPRTQRVWQSDSSRGAGVPFS